MLKQINPKERSTKLKNLNTRISKIDKLLEPLYEQRSKLNSEIYQEGCQKMIGKCLIKDLVDKKI